MIRRYLYLLHLSGSAYELLHEAGLITLTSLRTLRDYTTIQKHALCFLVFRYVQCCLKILYMNVHGIQSIQIMCNEQLIVCS